MKGVAGAGIVLALACQVTAAPALAEETPEQLIETQIGITTDSAATTDDPLYDTENDISIDTAADSASLADDTLLTTQDRLIASGTWGTCPWQIDEAGKLTISAGTGDYNVPWRDYRQYVTSVIVDDNVVLPSWYSSLFANLTNVVTIDIGDIDTSNVTSASPRKFLCTFTLPSWTCFA